MTDCTVRKKKNSLIVVMHRAPLGINGFLQRLVDMMAVVLMLIASVSSSVQPSLDCFTANQTCYTQRGSSCRNAMNLLYKVCGRSVEFCESTTGTFCRSHLITVRTTTVYRDCLCPDSLPAYHQCDTIWRLINKNPCDQVDPPIRRPGIADGGTNGRDNAKNNKPKVETDEDIFGRPLQPLVPSVDRGINCLDVQRDCKKNSHCLAYIDDFRKGCSIEECGKNSDHCLTVYEKVRAFNVFNCGCRGVANRDRCESFRAQFLQNKCLTFLNTQATQGGNPGRNRDRPSSGTDTRSSLAVKSPDGSPQAPESRRIATASGGWRRRRRQRRSCHAVLLLCMARSDCLSRLLALSEGCRPGGTEPSVLDCQPGSLCMNRLSSFYASLDDMAREALTCDCIEGDPMCSNARDLLRPRCAYMHSGTTCNAAFRSCMKDRSCQHRYDNYQVQCRPKSSCTSSDRALCLDGIAALMGTILTQKCSCHSAALGTKERHTCLQIKERLEKPSCLQNEYKINLGPPSSGETHQRFIDGSSICRLRTDFPRVYTQPYVRIDRNDSCSELCECLGSSMATNCFPIDRSCSSPAKLAKTLVCSRWLATQDVRSNRRRDCVCIPGEARTMCLTRARANKLTRGPGFYVSLLYSRSEKAKLASVVSHETYDLDSVGRTLDSLLDALSGRPDPRRWRATCRLRLVRDSSDVATFRLVNVDSASCQTRLRLLKLLAGANFPIIRHHPLLSIIRKVLVTTVSSNRDRYLSVKDSNRWGRGDSGLTTAPPGGSGSLSEHRLLAISVLVLWVIDFVLGSFINNDCITLSILR